MANYYEVLGIQADASPEKIKQSYYRLALKFHPDKSQSNTTAEFQRISEAYQVLSNPKLRCEYDRNGITPDNDYFQDPAVNFKEFVAEFLSRWNISPDVANLVSNTISQIKPGKPDFNEFMKSIDKTTLISGGLGLAHKFITTKREQIEEELTQRRIEKLPIRAWRYEIDMNHDQNNITIDVDIAKQIEYSHIELVFTMTGKPPKSIMYFIDYETELEIKIWERELSISFELRAPPFITRIGKWDVILREPINPCHQIGDIIEWSWEYGTIRLSENLRINETYIYRIDGEGLTDWVSGSRGRLWLCFQPTITASVRRLVERIDADAGNIRDSLNYEEILANL